MNIKRGEVYLANLPKKENSRIQGGKRPIVILSNDLNNRHCDFIHYIPLTSKIKRLDLPVHILLQSACLPKQSMALCEQIDKEEKGILLNYIDKKVGCMGKLSEYDMIRISYGVATQMDFDFMIKPQYAYA